jgi:hypothetical protein
MIKWTHTWFDPKGALSAAEVAELAGRDLPPGCPAALRTRATAANGMCPALDAGSSCTIRTVFLAAFA